LKFIFADCGRTSLFAVTGHTSASPSKPFEAYAIDSCDTTSFCENTSTGTDNSQTNDCTNFSACRYEATGNSNNKATVVIRPPGVNSSLAVIIL
jgi:hypothetical protein